MADKAAHECDVLIVGAGLSGILAAIRLKDIGIPAERIVMVDAADGVGGTWHWNDYPGCAVDNWSYAYLPLLDRTKFVPSKRYPPRDEINSYINTLVDHQGLRDIIRFRHWVTSLQWNEESQTWTADAISNEEKQIDPYTHEGGQEPNEHITARHVILGGGPIAFPVKPDFPGLEDKFQGAWLKTARYDKSVSLEGKRVAIVGTGCSCAQVIESIGYHDYPKGVKELLVFQRTPSWCLPREDEPTPDHVREEIVERGGKKLVTEYFAYLDSLMPMYASPFPGNKELRDQLAAGIRATVKDQAVAEKLIPVDVQFFAKRPLVMDHYHEAYNNPKVKLIAEGGVVSADETGLTTKEGNHYDVDVVITGAGFDAFRPHVNTVVGRDGIEMNELWGFKPDDTDFSRRRMKTMLGIHTPKFPNLYTMIGPQSLNPAVQVPRISDSQAKHIAEFINDSLKKDFIVEASEQQANEWTEECGKLAEGKVYGTVTNWYNKGGNYADENNYWGDIIPYIERVESQKVADYIDSKTKTT